MEKGEEKAWDILKGLDPQTVCRESGAVYDAGSRLFTLRSCGMEFLISPDGRTITSDDPHAEVLLGKLAYFFRLYVPWYMVGAKDIPQTGRMVKPASLPGGQFFLRGSHVLPLDKLAERYGADTGGFSVRGVELGGERTAYGDASFRFFPLPRVPVTMILWAADEEFPPRADILFDSTCELHLPLDIIWSVAMMSILVLF